jgi:hypothetical protein
MSAEQPRSKPASSCPKCGNRLRLRPDQAGEQVRCPKCGAAFVVGRPAARKPASPDDEYEPERPLKKSTIVEEPQVIRVEPAPAFTQGTSDDAALDAAPEPTLVPRAVPIPPAGPEYTADWADDVPDREPPHVRPLSMEPDYLEQARERGLIRDDTTAPLPKWTFFSGVFSYPWRTGSIARWAVMREHGQHWHAIRHGGACRRHDRGRIVHLRLLQLGRRRHRRRKRRR